MRSPSENRTEFITACCFRCIRHQFNLSNKNTRNSTKTLGLRECRLTKTRIQVKSRGSCITFPTTKTSQCPDLSITWTWVIPEALSASRLPAAAPRPGYGNTSAPFSRTDSWLPGIFTCITQSAPPGPM